MKGCITNSKCPNYIQSRHNLIQNMLSINDQIKPSPALFLYGSNTLPVDDNVNMFKFVYKFIQKSNRVY